MKKFFKLVMVLVSMTFVAQATTLNNPVYTECSDWHNGCGTDGLDGINGVDGLNGIDGLDGLSAYEIATVNGFVGNEQEWLVSLVGEDGETLFMSSDVITQAYLDEYVQIAATYENILEELQNASKLANQAIAGSVALSAIDFGTTTEGKTEVGMGIGVSDSYVGTDYAGALGIKYGFTDDTSGVIKGWVAEDAFAVGVAVVYGF